MIKALWRRLTGDRRAPAPEPAAKARPVVEAPPAPAASGEDDLPGLPFLIRPFEADDGPALVRVFRAAIQTTAADHYDAAQRAAWSAGADDPAFLADLAEGLTMVAEWQGTPSAFAQLVGHRLTLIYVHPDAARLGIATLLYHHLEDEARIQGLEELVTEASRVAHDFFVFLGFDADGEEIARRQGVDLPRWRMRKRLV